MTRPVLLLLTLALALPGCRRWSPVPDENTSLALPTGEDPGPPRPGLTMVWHHHSTGDNLLKGGLLEALKKDHLQFYDINYKEAKVGDHVIGDHTDPKDFPKNFNTPEYFQKIVTWELPEGRTHDIVMFKSCYPASDIKDDQALAAYQGYYNSLLPTFKAHPEILFIAMSTPPLVKGHTTPETAARARRWSGWITGQYARELKNVKVFDLFGAMAILEGKPDANTLPAQFAADRYDSHPTDAAARAVTRMFIPWLNRALRESGKVQ